MTIARFTHSAQSEVFFRTYVLFFFTLENKVTNSVSHVIVNVCNSLVEWIIKVFSEIVIYIDKLFKQQFAWELRKNLQMIDYHIVGFKRKKYIYSFGLFVDYGHYKDSTNWKIFIYISSLIRDI